MYLDAISTASSQVVANEAARLAWSGAVVGSVAVQTDTAESYILSALPAATAGNWIKLLFPASVVSVAGKTGAVSLDPADVGLGNANNTADLSKPISTATQAALDLKAPIASPTFTGTVSGVTKAMVGLGSVDNTADLAKPVSTATQTALDLKVNSALLAAASGVATLGADSKLLTAQIPDSLLAGLKWQGTWNAATNTPAIPAAAPANNGFFYKVSAAGTNSITGTSINFTVGDWLISNGTAWQHIDNTDAVVSVAGKSGVVVLVKADVGLSNVDNTSDANKPISTATQAALDTKIGSVTPLDWVQANAYTANTLVKYTDNSIYMANAAIPANTVWSTGLTGATWRQVGSTAGAGAPLDYGIYRQTTGNTQVVNNQGDPLKVINMAATIPSAQWNAATQQFVCSIPGRYAFSGRGSWATSTANGVRQVIIYKNGVVVKAGSIAANSASSAPTSVSVETVVDVLAGDTVEIRLWHNAGSSQSTVVTTTGHFCELAWQQVPTTVVQSGVPVNDQSASGVLDIGNTRIMWGVAPGASGLRTITLPAAFKDANYTITANTDSATGDPPQTSRVVMLGGKTTTSFKGRVVQGSDASSDFTFQWQAIGRKP
jgi:hypothetical protein